jgi:uncharacterized damage-inducible protein DinB
MRTSCRSLLFAATFVVVGSLPSAGQTASVTADLVSDVTGAEKKFLDLARAIPAEKYDWRPGSPPVRTVAEVLLHLAADNYWMPAAVGFQPDASTGIKGGDYSTAEAFEKRRAGKDQIVAELETSFGFLKKAISSTPAAKLGDQATMFGMKVTLQQSWIMAVTHLHEHLGQLIAYARMNGIKPPWSKE